MNDKKKLLQAAEVISKHFSVQSNCYEFPQSEKVDKVIYDDSPTSQHAFKKFSALMKEKYGTSPEGIPLSSTILSLKDCELDYAAKSFLPPVLSRVIEENMGKSKVLILISKAVFDFLVEKKFLQGSPKIHYLLLENMAEVGVMTDEVLVRQNCDYPQLRPSSTILVWDNCPESLLAGAYLYHEMKKVHKITPTLFCISQKTGENEYALQEPAAHLLINLRVRQYDVIPCLDWNNISTFWAKAIVVIPEHLVAQCRRMRNYDGAYFYIAKENYQNPCNGDFRKFFDEIDNGGAIYYKELGKEDCSDELRSAIHTWFNLYTKEKPGILSLLFGGLRYTKIKKVYAALAKEHLPKLKARYNF